MNRGKFDFDKSAKLGLSKKVQKKHQDKDSVSDISCVHSIDEAVKCFRRFVDHNLESCVQVGERDIISDHLPGKTVEYNATGLPKIVIVVREWDVRPGFTIHLAGPKMFSEKNKKNILKSPLLDSYVCNKKQMGIIPNQGPLFQDPIDPFTFKVEVIEEIAKFFLTCIPKKFKREVVTESAVSLGLAKKVQKIHQETDLIDNISCVHSPKEAVEMFRLLVDDKLKIENREFTIKEIDIESEIGRDGWKVSYMTPRITVYLVVRTWMILNGFTLHLAGLNELTPLVIGNPLTSRYIINKKQVETNKQRPLFQDPEDPNIFKTSVLEKIASMFLESIIELDKKSVNESSQTSLGLSKKVQKKHEGTDSIDNVTTVVFDKAEDFIDVMRSCITNKDLYLTFDWGHNGSGTKTSCYSIYYDARPDELKDGKIGDGVFELGYICIQTKCIDSPNNFSLKFIVWPNGDESYKAIWYEPINTLYSKGDEKFGVISLDEAKNAAKFIMKMFEETKDTYAYVPEAIEESSLGLNKRVQKIHDTRDAVSEVDPLLDFNSFFDVFKDFLKNKIKEHEDTRINDLFEEFNKQKYANDNKDMIEVKLKMGFDFDSERITVNLYFDENSTFIKNIWSFASFLGAPYGWDIEEKFSSEFLTEKSAPLVKRGLILSVSSASALADAIIEQALAYLDSYDEMTASSSVHESVNLGLARRVVKSHEDRDSLDAVNDVELDEDEFMKIAEKTFLKIPGIAVFDGPKVNLYSDEKYKYVSIFTEDNLDSTTRTTTKNGNNLGISCPIYLTIRKRQDGNSKGFYLYFLENTKTDKAMSSTYQLFGVGDIGTSDVMILSKYFKDRDSKYISDLTVGNIVKAADWLRDFIINAFPGEINESALGLNSKVSNKFKSEHTASKEIDEMSKMGIDEFENYFTEMCSSLSFPEFKELRIKIIKTQLGDELFLKYTSTTGSDKKQKRFNGRLDWFVDEDTGEIVFTFWIDNNLYRTDNGYNTKKFGTSKKYVEKYFLLTYKNLKDCIAFIEEYVSKNIKTIKKTFDGDTSLDESMSLGLSKKVQDKHEGHKEEAIENISILDPNHFFDNATDIIHKMLPDYALANYFDDKFYIDDPWGIGKGPFVKCRVANFSKRSTRVIAFALVIDLDNNKFVLWKYNFKVAPYHENKTSIKKKILSQEAKKLSISELRDELQILKTRIVESFSLGLASKAKKIHSEKDSVAALSELDEGAFLDMIADVVADEVGKLNDEVQKHPYFVKRNMSFKSYVFEKPIENGNVKVYCCYTRSDGSQAKRLASNLLIPDLKYCYDKKPKFVAYVSGISFKGSSFRTVYYSESLSNHKTEEPDALLIQNSLSITNVNRFGDFLYRETKARLEGDYF